MRITANHLGYKVYQLLKFEFRSKGDSFFFFPLKHMISYLPLQSTIFLFFFFPRDGKKQLQKRWSEIGASSAKGIAFFFPGWAWGLRGHSPTQIWNCFSHKSTKTIKHLFFIFPRYSFSATHWFFFAVPL